MTDEQQPPQRPIYRVCVSQPGRAVEDAPLFLVYRGRHYRWARLIFWYWKTLGRARILCFDTEWMGVSLRDVLQDEPRAQQSEEEGPL